MNITQPNDYNYFPLVVKTTSINSHECYEINEDKDLSLKRYLDTIITPLTNLINKKKNDSKNTKFN